MLRCTVKADIRDMREIIGSLIGQSAAISQLAAFNMNYYFGPKPCRAFNSEYRLLLTGI